MNIVLLGPTGAGKGTQAERLCRHFHLLQIATGALLRDNLDKRTALGLLARRYMDHCELVPDEVVDAMLEERLEALAPDQDVLFNGSPRTVEQAAVLHDLLERSGRRLDAVILLDIPEDETLRRLAARRVCGQCNARFNQEFNPPARPGICDACGAPLQSRADDDGSTARKRLATFRRRVGPVLDHYRNLGLLAVIDGQRTAADVTAALLEHLDQGNRAESAASRAARSTGLDQLKMGLTGGTRKGAPTGIRPSGRLNLGLIGGPGSGKGTQAEGLIQSFNLCHVASGDLFRDNLKNNTRLGQLARTYMNRGELVPDDITEAMVEERLACPDTQRGYLLDGFPRTLPQAQALAEMTERLDRPLAAVLSIQVPDEVLVDRLSGRWICRNCQAPYHMLFKPPKQPGVCDPCQRPLYQREDDTPGTVRSRLKIFHKQTEPLIAYYRAIGMLVEIDGNAEIAVVRERTVSAVRQILESARGAGVAGNAAQRSDPRTQ